MWGGMFSTFDCAVKGYRQKEDAWNAIISGFMTGGCLAARSNAFPPIFSAIINLFFYRAGGPRAAFGSAVACGILLGVFEGVGVLLNRVFSEGNRQQLPPCAYITIVFIYTSTDALFFYINSTRKHVLDSCTINPLDLYILLIFTHTPHSSWHVAIGRLVYLVYCSPV